MKNDDVVGTQNDSNFGQDTDLTASTEVKIPTDQIDGPTPDETH